MVPGSLARRYCKIISHHSRVGDQGPALTMKGYIMTKKYTYTKNEDDFMGAENRIEDSPLNRIADAMEEILRLVKKDMEPKKK